MLTNILVLHGPNLNMLGTREPEIYGHETLEDVNTLIQGKAKELGVAVECKQSNNVGELVTWIQQARDVATAIVINAGAYTHTSVAIADALRAAGLPVYEVHLSNIYRRESFRHHSFISKIAVAVICGLGPDGDLHALTAASNNAT